MSTESIEMWQGVLENAKCRYYVELTVRYPKGSHVLVMLSGTQKAPSRGTVSSVSDDGRITVCLDSKSKRGYNTTKKRHWKYVTPVKKGGAE